MEPLLENKNVLRRVLMEVSFLSAPPAPQQSNHQGIEESQQSSPGKASDPKMEVLLGALLKQRQ